MQNARKGESLHACTAQICRILPHKQAWCCRARPSSRCSQTQTRTPWTCWRRCCSSTPTSASPCWRPSSTPTSPPSAPRNPQRQVTPSPSTMSSPHHSQCRCLALQSWVGKVPLPLSGPGVSSVLFASLASTPMWPCLLMYMGEYKGSLKGNCSTIGVRISVDLS